MKIPEAARRVCKQKGYDPEELVEAFWRGIAATVDRPGSWEACLAFDFLESYNFKKECG